MARISLHLHWRRGRSKQGKQCWSWWSYQNLDRKYWLLIPVRATEANTTGSPCRAATTTSCRPETGNRGRNCLLESCWPWTMHMEGRSYSGETILKIVELNKDESGNLHSVTLSDGNMSATISKNYLPHLSAITTLFCRIRPLEKFYSTKLCTKSIFFLKTRR